MGNNRNYTDYSKRPVESKTPVESIAIEEPEIEEPKIEDPKISEPKYITGIVTDCLKLNVREDPRPTASILGTVRADTEVVIIEEESTEEFYKVCTPAGLEGYCMKNYITIIP